MSERIPLVPLCPSCGASLPYAGAAHTLVAGCALAQGSIPSDLVEYGVFEVYASYPSLYGRSPWSRWYIFEHLFFVNGCGYEWLGGKLIDVCREEPRDRVPVVLDALGELSKHRAWEAKLSLPLYTRRTEAEEVAAIERSWARFEQRPPKYYPLSEYANILQVPADAELSWVLAACDATRMFTGGQPEGQSMRQILALLQTQANLFAGLGLPLPAPDDPRMTGEILAERERCGDAHTGPRETMTALVQRAADLIALYSDGPDNLRDLSPLSNALQLLGRALELSGEDAGASCTRAAVPTLLELRKSRGLTLVQAAAGLRLGPDVWKKFEAGMILPDSLQDFQIARLAAFFEVCPLTFVAALRKSFDQRASAPAVVCSRGRYTRSAQARPSLPTPQLFETALARSQMSAEAKRSWLLEH